MSKKKPKKDAAEAAVTGVPLQVVWKNPVDGEEYGLDVCVCPEFGCLVLGTIEEPRVQHHIAKAHARPSGILTEIGMQRMAATGLTILQGQTLHGHPMQLGGLQ